MSAQTGQNTLTQDAAPSGVPAKGDLATRLRTTIVNGDFSPEERLKFAVLSKRFDAGYGTLREALSQLATEGYVTQETNKGFAVAPISQAELVEITDHLVDLEQRAMASAIEHGDDSWETGLVAAHHRLHKIEKCDWEERVARHSDWVLRHRAFHEALVSACPGRWLLKMRAMMFDQLDRYRFLTKLGTGEGGASRGAEHRMLMEAALDRDAKTASQLMDTHIRKTSQRAVLLLGELQQER